MGWGEPGPLSAPGKSVLLRALVFSQGLRMTCVQGLVRCLCPVVAAITLDPSSHSADSQTEVWRWHRMSQSPPLVTVGMRMQDVGFQTQGPFCSVCRRPGEAEPRPLLREGEDGRGAPGSGPKGGHRAQSSQPEFWASAWSPREPLATPWGSPGGLSQEETCSPRFLHVFQRPAGL